MKYERIRHAAIYVFIGVTVAMTLLGVLAVWDLTNEEVLGRSLSTVFVVGFGCVVIAYAASLLERQAGGPAAQSSAAPAQPRPIPPSNHLAKD